MVRISIMRVFSVAVALYASAFSVEAGTPGKIKDWAINPASNTAIIVLKVPTFPFDYYLSFSKNGKSGFMVKQYRLRIPAGQSEIYVGRDLEPGRYTFMTIIQQGQWSSCFSRKTFAFDITPGKVHYLGSFNVAPLLTDLQNRAIGRGRAQLSAGGLAVDWTPTIDPEWPTPTNQSVQEAQEFVTRVMPKTSAPVNIPKAEPASFVVSGGGKFSQICG
jgi:hypothetical protein